jgi:ferrous iron transport protein B
MAIALNHPPTTASTSSLLAPAKAAEVEGIDLRWATLKLVDGDDFAEKLAGQRLGADVSGHRAVIEAECSDEVDIVVADGRYRFIGKVMAACHSRSRQLSATLTQVIDAVVLNRFLGMPVFLIARYLMFLFIIAVGGAFIDFFDKAASALCVDTLSDGLACSCSSLSSSMRLHGARCLCHGPRHAGDRPAWQVFRASYCGLWLQCSRDHGDRHAGKPARPHPDHHDGAVHVVRRAPAGVALFAAAFLPVSGQNIVFALYLIGIGFAVLTGLFFEGHPAAGAVSHFIMEPPPYHIPTLNTVVIQAGIVYADSSSARDRSLYRWS